MLVGGGDLTPSEHGETLFGGDALDAGLLLTAGARLPWEERETRGVLAARGEVERGDLTEEGVGHLGQDACAIAGAGVGADRTAVLQVAQRLERQRDDVVRGFPAQRGDHGQAAGVLLERRIVQTLSRG